MKAMEWQRYLESQRSEHGKVLYRVGELANVAGRNAQALNVELSRLLKARVIARYATGIYGLPGVATVEQLVAVLDSDAYITGMYALYRHNMIMQAPAEITCFTNHRHNRSTRRATPFGNVVLHCVNPKIYDKPKLGIIAPPEQALCDLFQVFQREGVDPRTVVTLRNVSRINKASTLRRARMYPPRVGLAVRELFA